VFRFRQSLSAPKANSLLLSRLPAQHQIAPRRVRHREIACEVCGDMFMPKQSTAKTCSDKCRQRLHRQRR